MSLEKGWIEKRQHDRKKAAWEVTYQVIGSEEATRLSREYRQPVHSPPLEEKSDMRAMTHDFSVSGLAMVGSQAFKSGTKLLLYIHHPSQRPSIVLVAEVVHSVPDSNGSGHSYRSGMKILGVDENAFHRMLQEL